jgi:type II secretory pathway pseudopilin PulG
MIIKKGAMFGLESRAFKKQFGELFLARMQSVTQKEAHGARIQTNRGAMFGLDARIALAIFGALSVISGAALYSAIQDAKVTATITELNELAKAYDSYILDTGVDLPRDTSSVYFSQNLLENDDNIKGWNGPYISYDRHSSGRGLNHPTYSTDNPKTFYIRLANDNSWGGTNVQASDVICSGSTYCYTWTQVYVPGDIATAIDKKIDGTLNSSEGNVRVYEPASGYYSVYVKHTTSLTKDSTI